MLDLLAATPKDGEPPSPLLLFRRQQLLEGSSPPFQGRRPRRGPPRMAAVPVVAQRPGPWLSTGPAYQTGRGLYLFQNHLLHPAVFSVPEKHRLACAHLRTTEVSHVQVTPVPSLPGEKHPPSSILSPHTWRVGAASCSPKKCPPIYGGLP